MAPRVTPRRMFLGSGEITSLPLDDQEVSTAALGQIAVLVEEYRGGLGIDSGGLSRPRGIVGIRLRFFHLRVEQTRGNRLLRRDDGVDSV